MRVLITGGTGMIGSQLVKSLLADGNQVWVLTRNPQAARLPEGAQAVKWDGRTTTGWGELASRVDGIINLAGENLGAGRWSAARKQRILDSRVQAGQTVTEAIRAALPPPKVLVQASAIGYYGPRDSQPVTEETGHGSDFQVEVCKQWEASTETVEAMGVRRVVIRTSVVLSAHEGALARMLLPFRLFAGGPLGNGKQGFSWIHPADEVAAIRFLLENEAAHGVFNLSAPHPLSNADFGRIIAKVTQRPYWLPAPAFALRLLLGEMSTLVLDGQFVLPKRLLELGFRFRFERAEEALSDLLR